MINVEFDRSHERYVISIEGHANHAPEGCDVVCAAASVLAFTLFRAIQELDNRGAIDRFYHSIEKGECNFDFSVREDYETEVRAAVDAVFHGFYLLEEKFPDAVRVV